MKDVIVVKKTLIDYILIGLTLPLFPSIVVLFYYDYVIFGLFTLFVICAILGYSEKFIFDYKVKKLFITKGWGVLLVSKKEHNPENIRVKIKPIKSNLVYWSLREGHYDKPVKEELGLFLGDLLAKNERLITGGEESELVKLAEKMKSNFGIVRV